MNNIFENAKFGDKFLTKNDKIALFIKSGANSYGKLMNLLFIEGEMNVHSYDIDGHCTLNNNTLDIVSRYQEPIDEDKLNELAEDCRKIAISAPEHLFNRNPNAKPWIFGYDKTLIYEEGFKDGYRKAMEE